MMAPDHAADVRRAELSESLASVRSRIAVAAIDAGRDAASVTLIAVTKGFPASDLALLLGLGVTDIGESRDQEARAKLIEVEAGLNPRVHFIGQLQKNKSRSVARYADVVHSVDRPELVDALSLGAERAGRRLDIFLQINLDEVVLDSKAGNGPAGRGGVRATELPFLAAHVDQQANLRLLGVMAVAPNGVDPGAAFVRLAAISAELKLLYPDADAISAGMSGDFELAIKLGATHVRVGSALLGQRTSTFG